MESWRRIKRKKSVINTETSEILSFLEYKDYHPPEGGMSSTLGFATCWGGGGECSIGSDRATLAQRQMVRKVLKYKEKVQTKRDTTQNLVPLGLMHVGNQTPGIAHESSRYFQHALQTTDRNLSLALACI